MTSHARPNTILIGAQRCGTSQLHRLMAAHPKICVPARRKETHYFDIHYHRGEDWYGSFFPDEESAKDFKIIAEATPDYFTSPTVAERIYKFNPECKLILSLRDPTSRFVSHYYHWKRLAGKDIPIDQFYDEIDEATKRGMYYEQLEAFLEYFPDKQIHLMIMEEWTTDPKTHLQAMLDFLGVDAPWLDEDIAMVKDGSVNARYQSRFPRTQRIMANFARKLRDYDLDIFVERFKKTSWFKSLKTPIAQDDIGSKILDTVKITYRSDIGKVEAFLGREIPSWPSRHA